MDGFDLPRGAGSTAAQKRKAIIPDPRNDENLAVAQTHLAFIRFHNRVVDTLPRDAAVAALREGARARHQALPVDDPHRLPAADLRAGGRQRRLHRRAQGVRGRRTADPGPDDADRVLGRRVPARALDDPPGLQLERPLRQTAPGTLDLLFSFSGVSGNLGGEPRLPSNWIADFRRLYDFGEANKPGLVVPASKFNRAMRIDTRSPTR